LGWGGECVLEKNRSAAVQARGAVDQGNGGARDPLHGREKLADLPHAADAQPASVALESPAWSCSSSRGMGSTAAGDSGSFAAYQVIFWEYAVVNKGSSSRYNLGANGLQTIDNFKFVSYTLVLDR
jgi:hypothetical protein